MFSRVSSSGLGTRVQVSSWSPGIVEGLFLRISSYLASGFAILAGSGASCEMGEVRRWSRPFNYHQSWFGSLISPPGEGFPPDVR